MTQPGPEDRSPEIPPVGGFWDLDTNSQAVVMGFVVRLSSGLPFQGTLEVCELYEMTPEDLMPLLLGCEDSLNSSVDLTNLLFEWLEWLGGSRKRCKEVDPILRTTFSQN